MAGIKADKIVYIYKNCTKVRSKNRRTSVTQVTPKEDFDAPNVIHFKSLVSVVGKDSGTRTYISNNEKVKVVRMGLSDEALLDLHEALDHYIKNVLTTKIK